MSPSRIYISGLSRARRISVFLWLIVFTLSNAALASGTSERSLPVDKRSPGPLISLGYEGGAAYAILVDKETQRVLLYEWKETLSLKHQFPCSTGEVAGRKQKSGDRKTPEGIYFFTEVFEKKYLSPIYGSRAFVLDYPNFSDRKSGREGKNIWLHGSDKPIKPRDSNGCIVMNNDDLDVLSQYIRLNRTPIIIAKRLDVVPANRSRKDRESLIRFFHDWKTALAEGDWGRFSACYSEPHGDLDDLREEWKRIRVSRQDRRFPFEVSLRNLTLLRGNPCVVAVFDQVIDLDHQMKTVTTKQLFLEETGKTWKIAGETTRSDDPRYEEEPPLTAAVNHLGRLLTDHRAILGLIAEWADAWSSKDIGRYRACYAPDFHGQGVELEDWIRRKERLNKRYDTIRIGIEDLNIEQGLKQSTATFLLRYDSSGYHAVGTKRLRLKRIGSAWKIDRETWRKVEE